MSQTEGMVTKLKNQLAAQGGQFQSMSTQLTPPNGSPVDINPINSSADEEGGTTIFGCQNDASIQKSNGLATLEKKMETRATPPSTIQMNVEKKTTPKLQTKRKNVYVSSDAMQRQAKKNSLHKSLNY
ncbi:hypothetical protein Tco_0305277 [Tanacetum coccineum]